MLHKHRHDPETKEKRDRYLIYRIYKITKSNGNIQVILISNWLKKLLWRECSKVGFMYKNIEENTYLCIFKCTKSGTQSNQQKNHTKNQK